MRNEKKICLPVVQEDGTTVHRTLRGEWLVGVGSSGTGLPGIWAFATDDEEKKWGGVRWWVIRSVSSKLVVYREKPLDKRATTVTVYDSFEAMQPHVPPSIYDEAMVKAGLKDPPQFTEIPLEGV